MDEIKSLGWERVEKKSPVAPITEKDLKAVFKLVDMDKNGYICKIVSRSHSDSGLVLWPHNLSAACGRR